MEALETVKKAIPTSRHAEMLLDSTLSLLGERAFVVSADEGKHRTVFLREEAGSSCVIPWPLMKLSLGRRGSFVGVPGEITDEVPDESGAAPSRLRNLQGGEVEILGDVGSFSVTYAGDGQVCETSRSGDEVMAMLARAVNAGGGNPVSLLAQAVADRDLASEAPGRVLFPEGATVSLVGAWRTGLAAMRRVLFDEPGREDAVWIAADSYAGTVLGIGGTREEAVEICRSQVELLRPTPPEPEPMPELTPEFIEEMGGGDLQMISAPAEDRPREPATPENTPIVLTRVSPATLKDGRVVLLLDDQGRAFGATVLGSEGGLTIIGHGVIQRLDFEDLDDRIDAAITIWEERMGPERPWPASLPPLRSKTWGLEVIADGSLEVRTSSTLPEFDAGGLDGAWLYEQILQEHHQ